MANSYQHIQLQIEKQIAFLIFNRPDQLNAMNREMMDEIIAGIESINQNDAVRVGVIKGQGRAFMAGADIKEYAAQSTEEFDAFQERGKQLYESIEYAPKPWIAAVNGFALGGGFEIALACDLILASETARMGLPEVFLNLVPGGGGTQRLVQKIGINRAKEMLFTGGQYPAQTLLDWGIVNRVWGAEEFEAEVIRFAQKLSRRPPGSLRHLKRLAHLSLAPVPFAQKIATEGKAVSELFHSSQAKKAIQDFIHKS